MTDRAHRPAKTRICEREPEKRPEVFLVLSLGQKRCAIRAANVRGVLPERPAALCPGAGRAVAGVVFYRGDGITVFDLGWVLTGQESRRERGSRIVALRRPGWAAVLVDGVLGLVPGPCQSVERAGAGVGGGNLFVVGSIRWLNHPVGVVDIERVLETERSDGTAAMAGVITAALDLP